MQRINTNTTKPIQNKKTYPSAAIATFWLIVTIFGSPVLQLGYHFEPSFVRYSGIISNISIKLVKTPWILAPTSRVLPQVRLEMSSKVVLSRTESSGAIRVRTITDRARVCVDLLVSTKMFDSSKLPSAILPITHMRGVWCCSLHIVAAASQAITLALKVQLILSRSNWHVTSLVGSPLSSVLHPRIRRSVADIVRGW